MNTVYLGGLRGGEACFSEPLLASRHVRRVAMVRSHSIAVYPRSKEDVHALDCAF
jgi:hypothetical protein